eukprot:331371-Alexandrium_andersonii.AAC.1
MLTAVQQHTIADARVHQLMRPSACACMRGRGHTHAYTCDERAQVCAPHAKVSHDSRMAVLMSVG